MALNRITIHESFYRNVHIPALVVGGTFALISLALSGLLILQHLKLYTNPAEQKWIIGVLFMVPVYATDSIISLWNPRSSITCDILRSCYEAFALYSFGSYLVACLGGEERVVGFLERGIKQQLDKPLLEAEDNSRNQKTSFRDFVCNPRELGQDLYTTVKFGIVQYMILKTLCALLSLILELFGVYGDGEFKWYKGYPYIAVTLNFSQMWALYCLVQFYNVTYHRLQQIKPLAKFISFKAIVFATWWQGVGIAIICYFGFLPEGKIQHGIQDFLICIEMAIAAVAHIFVFSAKPYAYLTVSDHGRIAAEKTRVEVKLEGHYKDKPAVVEEKEIRIKAPGTSITESVQDVFLGGGEHVVKDVVLTITQAVEPVEKGVSKIQETFHQITVGSEGEHGGPKVEVEENFKEGITEHRSHVLTS